MGDMPPKELAANKSSSPAKTVMQSKAKKGSVLSAIEDIQRMSPDDICQEFDRLMEYSQRHYKRQVFMPCTDVAEQLQRCLRQHPQESFECFNAMENYRQCIGLATQDHVDQMAVEDEQAIEPLPVMPPQTIPHPSVGATDKLPHRRSWYKPWTWLR